MCTPYVIARRASPHRAALAQDVSHSASDGERANVPRHCARDCSLVPREAEKSFLGTQADRACPAPRMRGPADGRRDPSWDGQMERFRRLAPECRAWVSRWRKAEQWRGCRNSVHLCEETCSEETRERHDAKPSRRGSPAFLCGWPFHSARRTRYLPSVNLEFGPLNYRLCKKRKCRRTDSSAWLVGPLSSPS